MPSLESINGEYQTKLLSLYPEYQWCCDEKAHCICDQIMESAGRDEPRFNDAVQAMESWGESLFRKGRPEGVLILGQCNEESLYRLVMEEMRANGGRINTVLYPGLLTRLASNYGTDEEIDTAIKLDWELDYQSTSVIGGKVDMVLREIIELYYEFCKQNQIPPGRITMNPKLMNAAANIAESDVDLVVGIPNGGAPVSNLAGALGKQTALIDYHRHWKAKPRWRQKPKIKPGSRILITDHDIVTGKTMKNVRSKVDELLPRSVSAHLNCFYMMGSSGPEAVNSSGKFESVTDSNSFCNEKVFTRILEVRNALREKANQYA